MITHPVAITLETYTTVLDKENLGDPHPTLAGAGAWYPPEAAHARDRRILAELHHQNLTHGNRISPQFAHTLDIVQRPQLEYATIAELNGTATTVRTATDGQHALLITSHDERIELTPIRVGHLGTALAAALPHTPPAQIRSLNCDPAELRALEKGKELPTGPTAQDAKRLMRFLAQPRTSAGQLCTAARDRGGTWRAHPGPCPFWLDTADGRGLLSPTGGGWLTFTGADTAAIAAKLHEMATRQY